MSESRYEVTPIGWVDSPLVDPNPIGLHRVQIVAVAGTNVQVGDLEALHGTPVIDVKPVLEPLGRRDTGC